MWLIGAALCFLAGGYRFARSRGRRREVWWWSFTTALLGVGAGSLFLGIQPLINAAVGVPNIAFLLSQIAFIVAAGSVRIYAHTLRNISPSNRVMWLNGIAAAAVAGLVILGWVSAPIHHVNYAGIDDIPLFYPAALTYEVLYNIYFGIVLADVARTSASQVHATPSNDASRRVGLLMVAAGSALGVVALICNLVHDLIQPFVGIAATQPWTEVGDILVGGCLLGISGGAITFLIGPEIGAHRRAIISLQELKPLWQRLTELYPGIVLTAHTRQRFGRQSSYTADRMLIEISDGLRLLPVVAEAGSGDVKAVAAALINPPIHGTAAAEVLFTSSGRMDEQQLATRLAHTFSSQLIPPLPAR